MPVTLAELAIHMPVSIQLFEKYGLDYYLNGKQSFREACEEKGLIFNEIDDELTELQGKGADTRTLEDMDIDRLIDFINGQYHSDESWVLLCIQTAIQQLITNLSCGPEIADMLRIIEPKFLTLKKELLKHCKKEDKVLFPYIRQLTKLRKYKQEKSFSRTALMIKNPIRVLEQEHVQVAKLLGEIRTAFRNYQVPERAPESYGKLMKYIEKFEKDFHMHLHIENNVLFPKLIALEEELIKKMIPL